jgi:hypothetical protein
MSTKKGQKYKIEPKEKTKEVFKKVVENSILMKDAVREVYHSKYNPSVLKKTNGWEKLMETYLPDRDLAKAHKELLNAGFINRIGFEKDIEDDEIKEVFNKIKGCKVLYIRHYKDSDKTAYVQMVDNNARKNALEMAYKLKNKYGEDGSGDKNLTINVVNYGNNDTTPLRAERLPTALLTEPKEIQNTDSSQEGWEVKDSIERTNKEVSKT